MPLGKVESGRVNQKDVTNNDVCRTALDILGLFNTHNHKKINKSAKHDFIQNYVNVLMVIIVTQKKNHAE